MSYKLICIDMDGTFLRDDKTVSERNCEALKKASEKGVKVVVCTGRLYASAKFYSELIGVEGPIITSNGSYIINGKNDDVIYKSVLGYENCMKILRVLNKYNIYPHFNSPKTVFTEKIVYSSSIYVKANKTLPEKRKVDVKVVDNWETAFKTYSDEMLKCIAIDDDVNKINLAKKEMSKFDEFEVVSSDFNNFEVMSKGVSKGRAAEILAAYYGIGREQVICIGDSENDLSMIKYAGLGIAMKNGDKCVKDIAKYITDTNNNDGVAKAVEKFVLC